MLAAVNAKATWYLTRGTGLVSLLLLTGSVLLGILEVSRWSSPRWPRFVTAGLHKNVSLLVIAFLGVHILTAVVDGFAPIRWLDVLVPFVSRYRPVWLGFGAVAVDLLIAISVTSLMRQRLGYRAWRVVHWMAYACWPVAFFHGLGTGSDTRTGWVLALSLGCLAAVVGSVWWRLAMGRPQPAGARTLAAWLSVVAPLVVLGWLVAGPLRAGWAARAGTPRPLLAAARARPTTTGSTTSPGSTSGTTAFRPPFVAAFSGTVAERGPDAKGDTVVTIDGVLSGGAEGELRIVLSGPADGTGGVELTSSSVSLGPRAQPDLYHGVITDLAGAHVGSTLVDAAGRRLRLTVDLQLGQTDNRATGTVHAT